MYQSLKPVVDQEDGVFRCIGCAYEVIFQSNWCVRCRQRLDWTNLQRLESEDEDEDDESVEMDQDGEEEIQELSEENYDSEEEEEDSFIDNSQDYQEGEDSEWIPDSE